MSIERGQATGASTAVTQQRPAAGKAGAQAAGGSDFLALLAGLDALAPAAAELVPGGEGGPAGRGAAATDAERAAAELQAEPAVPVPGDAAAAAALLAAEAAAAAQQSAARTPGVDQAQPPVAADAAGVAERAARQAAPQQALAEEDSAARRGEATAPAAPAVPAALAPEVASVFEQLKHRLAAREAATPARADAIAPATTGAGAANHAGQRDARGERGFSAPVPQAAWARAEAAVVGQGLAVEAAPGRSALRGAEGLAAARVESAWTPQEFTPTVHYDTAVTSVDAPPQPPSPEQPLTEQLRYWVSQGMRSAELTVHGDADPVQVSIAMQGNEAHVTFRSEQAATREMLTGTVDQLRDLLQAQGMVLSGVSVGAHDAGGRRGQSPGAEPQARPAAPRVGAAEPRLPAASAAAARTAAGGLDLYV